MDNGGVALTIAVENNAELDESAQLIDRVDALGATMAEIRGGIGRVIFGQSQVIEETLITAHIITQERQPPG